MYLRALLLSLLISSPAFAQSADPAFLQRAITAVQTQRNLAMDAAAVAEAKVSTLTDDLAKAQAKIKELEAKDPNRRGE